MLKKYLIEKPMVLNFYLTLFLKLVLIIISTCIGFISKDFSLFWSVITVSISLIVFYRKNKKELEFDLGSAKDQIYKMLKNGSVKYSWNLLLYIIMYVVLYIFYYALIMRECTIFCVNSKKEYKKRSH